MYALVAPGRVVSERDAAAALRIVGGHLALGPARRSFGLAVVIMHGGGDGDHVLVHSWIEADMSDLAVSLGPAGQPDGLRPGRAEPAPCVREGLHTIPADTIQSPGVRVVAICLSRR
ncbi:hypothetical protein GCM10010211_39920 [Streptomyces albospinus]|uniref:Uncharacterized protein n=1 Tax=Streptomyces albospinus TaxID=285515 RepID=A0ABQ2V6H5_9ACTN|nr:hypothetical protein [Streptomyces albospinus]GGU70285.1 hypothetical protein GCM10010211_39920 [Streptomyces albospinus]